MQFAIRSIFSLLLCAICLSASSLAQSETNDSPTDAYMRLYSAVKGRDTATIKLQMSQKSLEFGVLAAGRNNTPVDKVYENGFTATTFANTLPVIRDERVKGDMGAVEVWNAKDVRWEDLPFVLEDGAWKLAVGELFAGTYKSPGRSRAVLEEEAANAHKAGSAPTPARTQTKKPAPYKITSIKIVPFDEITGQFREPVDAEQWFGNDLSMSLFVTIELSGDPGGFVAERKLQITAKEGKKVKLSRVAYPGVFNEQGKYYVPVWLYGAMCDPVKITVSVVGQKQRSSMSRTVNFHCGE